MGVRLKYAKVVDRELFLSQGGTINPGLDNRVQLLGEAPAKAGVFEIHRNWYDMSGAFTESWRIIDSHGRTLYTGLDREVIDSNHDLVDEVVDLEFEYTDDNYAVVFDVDEREVARVAFSVVDLAGEPDVRAL